MTSCLKTSYPGSVSRAFLWRHKERYFGSRKVEVTGNLKILHNEKLHNLYSSPDIVRVIKTKRMQWGEKG
jgi:hypothetical protein